MTQEKLREEDNLTISELPIKKQGRPLLLRKKLNEVVQKHVLKLRDHRCPINTSILIAVKGDWGRLWIEQGLQSMVVQQH